MGKHFKNNSSGKQTRSKTKNKDKNLKKKKKTKHKTKLYSVDSRTHCVKDPQKYSCSKFAKDLSSLCQQFKIFNQKAASPKDIFRAKHLRDQKLLNNDVDSICDNFEQLCGGTSETNNVNNKEEECFAEVENLSKNVNDLFISTDNLQPGFQFSSWQKKKINYRNRRKNKLQ